jgi:DNA invertase Pin-like site-specific DNA recombinase
VRQLTKAGCKKVFREVASGAKTDRAQLRRLLDQLDAGDVLMVTRLDRLARSTRDLLNTLAAITAKQAGFKSLGDTWADTTTSHGRLMLTVLSVADEMSGFGSRRSVRFLGEFQTGGSGCGPRYGWRGMWRHWSDIEAGG